MEIAF